MNIVHRLTVSILLLYTLPAAAEIHRCTGDDGAVTFSDSPCGEQKTTFGKYRPAENHGTPANVKQMRLLQAFEVERRQAQQQADAEAAKRAERASKCRYARDRLRAVRQAGRIYNVDDNGERVVQSDAARAETERQAEDYVNYWCD